MHFNILHRHREVLLGQLQRPLAPSRSCQGSRAACQVLPQSSCLVPPGARPGCSGGRDRAVHGRGDSHAVSPREEKFQRPMGNLQPTERERRRWLARLRGNQAIHGVRKGGRAKGGDHSSSEQGGVKRKGPRR